MPWEGIFYGSISENQRSKIDETMGIASQDVNSDTKTISELKQHISEANNFTNLIILNAQQVHSDRFSTMEQKIEIVIGVVGLLIFILIIFAILKCYSRYSCQMNRRREAIPEQ